MRSGYLFLTKAASRTGVWFLSLSARIIASFIFIFSGKKKNSVEFYQLLYPDRSKPCHLYCTFRQYISFTTIHTDRFRLSQNKKIEFSSEGWQHIEKVTGNQGGILLMSHLGNWEIAAHLMKQKQKELPLLLYMGIKEKEGVEKMQKDDLQASGIKIIGIKQGENSMAAGIEAAHWLKKGGLVSISGDIVWQNSQPAIKVPFLGHYAMVPRFPYALALSAGVPIFVFFTIHTGKGKYHFKIHEPIVVHAENRSKREEAMDKAAEKYAALLAETVKKYPYQWYHFDSFIIKKYG